MANVFAGWCKVALAAASVLSTTTGCGESFSVTGGAGNGGSTTSGTTTTEGGAGSGGTVTTSSETGGSGGTGGAGGTTTTNTGECQNGDTQDCYDGLPPETLGKGICKAGTATCVGGQWSTECFNQVKPAAQDNCANMDDDDCDGAINNGCECTTGTVEDCYDGAAGTAGVGPCKGGQRTCDASGHFGACENEVVPKDELCTNGGIDDDCDGTKDNIPMAGNPCPTGKAGVCATGTFKCGEIELKCVQDVMSEPETCDGLDNDCNNLVDESYPEKDQPCFQGGGQCSGVTTCVDGMKQCKLVPKNQPEICGDQIDNNCDGVKDPQPATYFMETFQSSSNGWSLGQEWEIGQAVVGLSAPQSFHPDPLLDHTNGIDNYLAGVVIGGNASTDAHAGRYLTSPITNLSNIPGAVTLSFFRWLNSDAQPAMTSTVEVWDGNTWVVIWQNKDNSGNGTQIQDSTWTGQLFDVTPFKSATFQIRFGIAVGQPMPLSVGSWSVDDVKLSSCYEANP